MKIILQLLLITFTTLPIYSQNIITIGSFPPLENNPGPVLTKDLLTKLNWETIKKYSASGHYSYESSDSFITTYSYFKQSGIASFTIKSYKDWVIQFDCGITTFNQNTKSSFFDKDIWFKYVNASLPTLPYDFKLTKEEPEEILKAYYGLLGIETADEYGWYCEYGSRSKPTQRRLAIIQLLKNNRLDLIKKLLNYSNIQTQLYAADGLIYLDFETNEKIELNNEWLSEKQTTLDSLKKLSGIDKEKIQFLKLEIINYKKTIEYLKEQLSKESDWKIIINLRDSKKEVKTCMNGTGSYRIYTSNTTDLLSEEAIKEVPKNYERFKLNGMLK